MKMLSLQLDLMKEDSQKKKKRCEKKELTKRRKIK